MENLFLATQTGGILGPFAWILGKILEVIYNVFSAVGIYNIGLCIIIFTLVVRLLMLPSSIKQNKSMKVNSYITPEIQAVQKKYENKKDQASQLKMQEEMRAVYDKYGTSPTGGCLPLLIQMPILFSLYSVIRNIPAYVQPVKDLYIKVINGLSAAQAKEFFGLDKAGSKIKGDELNQCIDAMTGYLNKNATVKLTEGTNLSDILAVAESGVADKIREINTFLGFDISVSPSEMPKESFVAIVIALIIPVAAGLFQYLSVVLSQKLNKTASNADNPMGGSMKMMNIMMPLLSVWMCYSFDIGIGIYWVAGSLIMMLQQIFLNIYFKDIDVNQIIEANKEKAAAKAEKRKAKEGIYREKVLEASKVNTRNYSSSQMSDAEREEKIRKAKEAQKNGNSIAARAGMVSEYNKRNEK